MSRGTWTLIAISVVLGSASCGKSEKQPPAVESAQAKKSADSNPGQLLPIAVGGKFGYIDTAGKFVISPKFSDGREFKDGLALVAEGGTPEKPERYGFIDRSGKFVIAPQFDDAGEFSQGLAAVMVGGVESSWGKTQGRWGLIEMENL